MDILGPATEEDMILEFVRAERDSPRQGGAWQRRPSACRPTIQCSC